MNTQQRYRANIKWPVSVKCSERSIEGVTLKLSPYGAYIRCASPPRLYEILDLSLSVPNSDCSIEAKVEVVFSNKYGPDDRVTPRGMGVRFLDISKEDRQIIAKQILDYLQSNNDNDNVDPKKLRGLQTLIVDLSEGETEVA